MFFTRRTTVTSALSAFSVFPLLFASVLIFASVLTSAAAHADWTLNNNASQLNFVTLKAEHIAEVHSFDRLSGTIGNDGKIDLAIDLLSVNTLIPIRNERMQEMLFETSIYPKAMISGAVDLAGIKDLKAGASKNVAVKFELNLHGKSNSIESELNVTKLAGNQVRVSTIKPILVSASQYNLVAGVDKLKEVAGLPSISQAVPVSFSLTFDPK